MIDRIMARLYKSIYRNSQYQVKAMSATNPGVYWPKCLLHLPLNSGNLSISHRHIYLLFSGGMELLFGNKKSLQLELPVEQPGRSPTIQILLKYLCENVLCERQELFMQGDTIRPGILILINEVDWELEGGLEYELKPNDCILFISTLHGG